MTVTMLIFIAALSCGVAAVAVTVAICTWAHNPGQVVPGWRNR